MEGGKEGGRSMEGGSATTTTSWRKQNNWNCSNVFCVSIVAEMNEWEKYSNLFLLDSFNFKTLHNPSVIWNVTELYVIIEWQTILCNDQLFCHGSHTHDLTKNFQISFVPLRKLVAQSTTFIFLGNFGGCVSSCLRRRGDINSN